MNTIGRIIAVAILSLPYATMTGCESNSAGAKLFRTHPCIQCHTIHGRGGAVGPNLSSIGSRRTREYIIQQIKDPASHNPYTDMPSFKGRLTEQEIDELADYLSGLK